MKKNSFTQCIIKHYCVKHSENRLNNEKWWKCVYLSTCKRPFARINLKEIQLLELSCRPLANCYYYNRHLNSKSPKEKSILFDEASICLPQLDECICWIESQDEFKYAYLMCLLAQKPIKHEYQLAPVYCWGGIIQILHYNRHLEILDWIISLILCIKLYTYWTSVSSSRLLVYLIVVLSIQCTEKQKGVYDQYKLFNFFSV